MRSCLLVFLFVIFGTAFVSAKNYYLNNAFEETWHKAFHLCATSGKRMATIASKEESDELEKLIRDSGFLTDSFFWGWWLGGTNLDSEPNFYWLGAPSKFTFTNWNQGEPNNRDGNEHCIQLKNSGNTLKWNDVRCRDTNYFICEDDI